MTISKNDIVIPPDKEKILGGYEKRVEEVHGQYDMGLITEDERHETIVNIWTEATDEVAARDGGALRRAEPGVHDGQLGRPRLVQADPPARRYARPDGEPEGRDHRAPDQGQLHGRPVGARVLHLDPRRPQGPRRHGAPHGRLGLPDAASRRRLAGRDRARGGLRHRRPHRPADPHQRRAEQVAARPRRLRRTSTSRSRPASPARRSSPRRAQTVTLALLEELEAELGDEIDAAGPLGAQVPRGDRRVPDLLRHLPGDGRDVRDRRRGRHHRRAVDRRAGHAADDADVPHRRCRRRGHHARPAARRRDLRGAEPEGCRGARRGRRPTSSSSTTERGPKITIHPTEVGPDGELADPVEYQLPRRTRLLVDERPGASSRATRSTRARRTRPTSSRSRARRRPSCTSSARCRRSTRARASRSTTSTSS